MSDLILEFLTEEIPARMQSRASQELKTRLSRAFEELSLSPASIDTFVTPRRLAAHIQGLPVIQPDIQEERKGPKVGAPEKALQGFMKANDLSNLDQCEIRQVGKAEFYFVNRVEAGQETAKLIPDLINQLIRQFPWPKSMHWGRNDANWVRPLQSVVCVLDAQPLIFDLPDFEGLTTGNQTKGHRFLAKAPIIVENFAQYQDDLLQNYVLLDQNERRAKIATGLQAKAAELGYHLYEDAGLLEEVTGLVEWPVCLAGKIDDNFLTLPVEVLTTSMRAHQKYFSLTKSPLSTAQKPDLAPAFITISNMETADQGREITSGNERVLRARLADADFFWQQDQKIALKQRVGDLKDIIFHIKLGTVADKIARLQDLSRDLARYIPGCDPEKAAEAALLAKTDLTTGMVGEFPELQGLMGQYYAAKEGYDTDICQAIADHYKPQGPSDTCPTVPTAIAVALADKLDSLVGFFAINERPTGSKDPFALRRSALGIIRLILENNLRLSLTDCLQKALNCYPAEVQAQFTSKLKRDLPAADLFAEDVMVFLRDRLQVMLKDQDHAHDLVQAALETKTIGQKQEDDLVRLMARIAALEKLMDGADGSNLLAAYRRAANILRIEEQKDKCSYNQQPDAAHLIVAEEKQLYQALSDTQTALTPLLEQEDFPQIMAELAKLRPILDDFFDHVMVNDEKSEIRLNRLRLLTVIRDTLETVADFSKFVG